MPFSPTDEQAQLLKYLHSHLRAAISSPAGTGKTFIAVQLAVELDRLGSKVLMLCRNPHLAESLRAQLEGRRVDVFAFPAFVRWLLESAGQPQGFAQRLPPKWRPPWTQFDAPSVADLSRALDSLHTAAYRYDAVLIDEGQDFDESWLDLAEACLSSEKGGCFYIFFDDNPRLSPFGPQRRYAAIQAPIALTHNCRSAAPIAALIRQLHPHPPEGQAGVDGTGHVREWVYSDEAELFEHLRSALLAAEDHYPGLKDVVVLSAETVPSRMSHFSGLVIDSPRLRLSPQAGGLHWQDACLCYLQGFGLLESDLSGRPVPTPEDIRRVARFCADYQANHRRALSRQNSMANISALRWHMDSFGVLSLHWSRGDVHELPAVDLLKFFASPGWANSLPPAHKRYRLTPAEDSSQHPFYNPVRLVDIPAFKGLEAEGVVFVLYNHFASDPEQLMATLYLAFSRARRLLYVISPSSS